MAGPWFTVQPSGTDWHEISAIWISNGQDDCKGRIDARIRLTTGGAEAGPPHAVAVPHLRTKNDPVH